MALRLFWGERDELGCHQVAQRTNVLLVLDAGQDTVEELRDVNAQEGRVQASIQRLISALQCC